MTRALDGAVGGRGSAMRSRSAHLLLVRIAAVLVVLGAVGWRRGEYFSGSLDPVVVAKALVSFLALGLAFVAFLVAGSGRRVGTGSLWWLGVLMGASVFGALTDAHLAAGCVIAVRVTVLAATVFFLLRTAPAAEVLVALMWGCGAIAVVASLTGLASLSDGRLAGGIPAMDPNELALLAAVPVVHLAWRAVLGRGSWPSLVTVALLLAVVWETGSRTALLMLVLGLLVMAAYVRRPRPGLVVGALVLVAAAAVGVALTGAISGFAERGGDGTSTLDSRLIAWRAALTWAPTAWQTVFGGGLSVKIIPVQGQYWATQPLDSSWVSLLVQTGILGVVVAVLWALWTLRGALLAPPAHRVLFLGLLVFLLGRSVLESGLFDATPAFLLFLAVSLAGEGGSRERLRSEEADREGSSDG